MAACFCDTENLKEVSDMTNGNDEMDCFFDGMAASAGRCTGIMEFGCIHVWSGKVVTGIG